jgi:hypothetical protein
MVGDATFKRFMNIRQQLFDVLAQWGEVSDRDGIIEVKIIFESGGNAKGASLNPYQKTDYELMVVGENHDGMLFEGGNFEHLLDQFEEEIKKMKK